MPLQIRRGNTAEVNSITPLVGELIYNTQTGTVLVGDGGTAGGVPIAGVTLNASKDAAAASLLAGTHKNISFSYDSVTKALSATVDILTHETIVSDAIVTDKIFNTASTVVIDVDTATVNGTLIGSVTGDVKGSVFADDSTLLVDAIDGVLRGTLVGTVTGDVKGSIFADDSTLLVDAVDGVLRGTLVGTVAGNVLGNVLGNVSGNVLGDVSGNLTGDVKGSVFAENSSIMVDATNGSINLDGTVQGDVIPNQNASHDLGSNTNSFRDLYLSGDATLRGNSVRTFSLANFTSDTSASIISFNKSRGTTSSPSTVNIGDRLGNILFRGFNGSTELTAAAITSNVDSTISPTNIPGNLEFNVRNTLGVLLTPLKILNSGIVRILSDTNLTSTKVLLASCHHDSSATTTAIGLSRSRGSIEAPTAVQDGDLIYNITYAGYDGLAYRDSSSIRAAVDGSISSSIVPGRLEFYTANSSGTLIKNAQLDKNGVLKVDNIQALTNTLSIVGDIVGSVFSDSSTLLVDGTNGSLKYYATVPGDWSGSAPTTVGEALDRLATLVKTLNAGVGA